MAAVISQCGFVAPIPKPASNRRRPVVLTIGGSDSAGLAGIQADNQIIHAYECHPASAITAVTAQNNDTVISINAVDTKVLNDQLSAVSSLAIKAVKIGLITSTAQARCIISWLKTQKVEVVWDPISTASSNRHLQNQALSLEILVELLAAITMITPNISEAEALTGIKISSPEDIEIAAKKLHQLGAKNVYIKGGHTVFHEGYQQDYFSGEHRQFWLSSASIHTPNTRGTGCILASQIACALAHHNAIEDTVVIAKMGINQAFRHSYRLGETESLKGRPHLYGKPASDDLPLLTATANIQARINSQHFPNCNDTPLGLYPVVDSIEWLQRLLPLGISTIQLRIKDKHGDDLEREIAAAIEISRQFQCRLFINDYWQLAIKYKAYGVHLGQEDLQQANIDAIRKAGLRLGISSHCYYEVATAVALKPSYIAIGPIYETSSKRMPWLPQGISKLKFWLNVVDYPLVAIGGINSERIGDVAATKVSGIAMISAITAAQKPEAATLQLKSICEQTNE